MFLEIAAAIRYLVQPMALFNGCRTTSIVGVTSRDPIQSAETHAKQRWLEVGAIGSAMIQDTGVWDLPSSVVVASKEVKLSAVLPNSSVVTFPAFFKGSIMKMKVLFLVLMVAASASCSKQAPIDTGKTEVSDPSIPLRVSSWGPQGTTVATPVNALEDGQSGLYFVLSRNVIGQGTQVMFDGISLGGVVVDDNVITAALPAAHLTVAGSKPIVIKLGSGQLLEVGNFVITGPNTDQTPAAEAVPPPAEVQTPENQAAG